MTIGSVSAVPTPTALAEATSLLVALADPAATQKKLAELRASLEAFHRHRTEAFEAVCVKREAALDERLKEVIQREARASAFEADLNARETVIAAGELDLAARVAKLREAMI